MSCSLIRPATQASVAPGQLGALISAGGFAAALTTVAGVNGATPADPAGPGPRLIFDGDCAFCTSSATWFAERLRRADGRDANVVPWQHTDLAAIGTSAARAQREVLWLASDGGLYGGAEACSRWLRHAGGAWGVLGRMLTLPGIRQLASAVYRLIARNRHRLPGGSPACAVPGNLDRDDREGHG
jgi:predicted DCC family thiol-disulfide oxidoreductase YuxK